ncbi:MAG: hypothetical protein ACK53A_03170 [Gemmatimonadota bacterium]|jgi:hypothetical protein|nr:hypothetical protein [Gemmatimonadota bacterium]
MSRLVTRARSRWPIAALLAGGLIATILTLVPARAEALDADGYCAATGFFFCFKPEVGTRPDGTLEVRFYYAGPSGSTWIF